MTMESMESMGFGTLAEGSRGAGGYRKSHVDPTSLDRNDMVFAMVFAASNWNCHMCPLRISITWHQNVKARRKGCRYL